MQSTVSVCLPWQEAIGLDHRLEHIKEKDPDNFNFIYKPCTLGSEDKQQLNLLRFVALQRERERELRG